MWKQLDPFEFCFFSFHLLGGSGAVFTPGLIILRQDLYQTYTLPNTLWAVRFSRLAVGTGIIPSPIWALRTINSNSSMSFLPGQHVVFSYTFMDRNSDEHSRGAPCQSQKLLLCFDSEAVITQESGTWRMGMLSVDGEDTAGHLGRRIPRKQECRGLEEPSQ